MTRRKSLIALGLVGAVVALTACGGGSEGSSETSSSSSGGEATSEEGAAGGGSGETLVIYSNSVSDGRGEWLTEQAAEAGFSLQFVDLGGGDITNRLIQEKNNPLADVVFGLNNVYFENIKAEGVLKSYTPAWSDDVDQSLGDTDGQFWPIVREPIMLVCSDTAYPDGAGAPSDWPDLWTDPAYHGLYEVQAGLGGATTQMVVSGILSRYRDDAGELGISEEGWQAISDYFEYGNTQVQGEDLYARMAAGTVNCGQMWLAGKFSREVEYGITTTAATPEVGVPMVVQHVALVANSSRSEEAKAFIDWFGSGEVQGAWSQEFGTAPANSSAEGDPEAVEFTDSFTAQDIDWTFVAQNLAQWIEKIELDYLG